MKEDVLLSFQKEAADAGAGGRHDACGSAERSPDAWMDLDETAIDSCTSTYSAVWRNSRQELNRRTADRQLYHPWQLALTPNDQKPTDSMAEANEDWERLKESGGDESTWSSWKGYSRLVEDLVDSEVEESELGASSCWAISGVATNVDRIAAREPGYLSGSGSD